VNSFNADLDKVNEKLLGMKDVDMSMIEPKEMDYTRVCK
jgi:hypothetical protein